MRKLSLAVLALVALAIVYMLHDGGATAEVAPPLSPTACRTMDEIFRPMGVRGKQQLLKHLIDASDRLALQSNGQLREAAVAHAAYVRLLYAEAQREAPGDTRPAQSTLPQQTHTDGLKAYDTIRRAAWTSCGLSYLAPAAS
ncbi:hypothetical protein Rhe02_48530 [Rhizocola hellebori]|uniref:Uncharacterized protein n=1 Tax=Rhizocola hellebori TaxID=1392758 RepID=A0A8J3QC54_9ACTN|nr:hypothetical protein [Rhizocola hellebori]GIH06786.1 hypothetical protein Rhe02_48530 [Rhizocola hellebori]